MKKLITIIALAISLNGYSKNFMDFVTNQTDSLKIVTNTTTQNYVNMSLYLTSAVDYCKTNGIKSLEFPSGTYRFNGITIDNLDNFYFVGSGAIIKDNNLIGTTAMWKFTNCNTVSIRGFSFIGTYGSYADFDFINISTGSGNFNIYDNSFINWRRSAINVEALFGGVASDGVNIYSCIFKGTSNYSNALQTAITLLEDGEYCKIHDNFFKALPSVLRATNGANGAFYNNTVLSISGQGFDPLYNYAIVYIDNTGSNNGKFDILFNKINHTGTGITAIVYKGVTSTPQNAGRIIGNDILVHGSATASTAIYLKNNYNCIIKDNKIRGNSIITSSGIIFENSNGCYVDGNNISNYVYGIELINTVDLKINYNIINSNVNYKLDFTSSFKN